MTRAQASLPLSFSLDSAILGSVEVGTQAGMPVLLF